MKRILVTLTLSAANTYGGATNVNDGTLLVTGAVVSSDLPDYTQILKERMGLGSINLESLRQQASAVLSVPSSPFSLPQ